VTSEVCDQLFVVVDGDRPLAPPSRHLLDGVFEVRLGRSAAAVDAQRQDGRLALAVPDRRVSGAHARLIRGEQGWRLEDLDSKNGTAIGGVRIDGATPIADGTVFSLGRTFLLFRAQRPASGAADTIVTPSPGPLPPTLSCELGAAFDELARVAATDTAILLVGEAGTGKERLAGAVHTLARRRGELVAIACGALPPVLAASEMFGHCRGAFAGAAADRTGVLAIANGGTLFLDDIGELPVEVQPGLRRVLAAREVVPLGGTQAIPLDVRVVAATRRDLRDRVTGGTFLAGLLRELAGFTLALPPLRKRREDLGLAVAEVIRRHAATPDGVSLTGGAIRALFAYSWPRNLRELDNAIRIAVNLADSGEVAAAHFADSMAAEPVPALESVPGMPVTPARGERRAHELARLLTEHDGNVAAVARKLGKQRTLIRRWLRRYNIDPSQYRK